MYGQTYLIQHLKKIHFVITYCNYFFEGDQHTVCYISFITQKFIMIH